MFPFYPFVPPQFYALNENNSKQNGMTEIKENENKEINPMISQQQQFNYPYNSMVENGMWIPFPYCMNFPFNKMFSDGNTTTSITNQNETTNGNDIIDISSNSDDDKKVKEKKEWNAKLKEDCVQLIIDNPTPIPKLEWFEGQRGTSHPCFEGYLFYHSRGNIYRCKHHLKGCRVTIKKTGETFQYETGSKETHNGHDIDYYNLLQTKKNKEAAKDLKNIGKTSNQIASENQVPESNLRRSTCIKQIHNNQEIPPNPKTTAEIIINGENRKHLLFQSNDMIIFGDKRLFSFLIETKNIYCDGTFSILPKHLFYQLYSIHVQIDRNVIPVFFGFLNGKSNDIYKIFFNKCEEISGIPFLHSKKCMLGDFEIANFNFLNDQIEKKSCIFHFGQNIYRKIQKIDSVEYETKGSFYCLGRCLMVLPLISMELIDETINYLKNKFTSENEKELLDYFINNYINGNYDIKMWNLRDKSIKSNNFVESHHNAFRKFVGNRKHLNIHELFLKLNQYIDNTFNKTIKIYNQFQSSRKKVKDHYKNLQVEDILYHEKDYQIYRLLMNLTKCYNEFLNEIEMNCEYEEENENEINFNFEEIEEMRNEMNESLETREYNINNDINENININEYFDDFNDFPNDLYNLNEENMNFDLNEMNGNINGNDGFDEINMNDIYNIDSNDNEDDINKINEEYELLISSLFPNDDMNINENNDKYEEKEEMKEMEEDEIKDDYFSKIREEKRKYHDKKREERRKKRNQQRKSILEADKLKKMKKEKKPKK